MANDILKRKMFAKGFQPGGQTGGPGSGPIDIIQGSFPFKMGQTFGQELKQGLQPGYLSNVAGSGIGTVYENLGNVQNYFLSPVFDLGKRAINELSTGFLGTDRTEFAPTPRVATSGNPYGLPVNLLNEITPNTFDTYYPPGTQVRISKIADIYAKGGGDYLRNTLGVSGEELQAAGVLRLPNTPPPGTEMRLAGGSDFLDSEMILAQAMDTDKSSDQVEAETKQVIEQTGGDASVMEEVMARRDQISTDIGEYPEGVPAGGQDSVTSMEQEQQNKQDNQNKQEEEFNFGAEVEKLKQELQKVTGPENSTDAALLLLKLGSNLMSGKTSEKGLTGFLDVLGQAGAPVVDTAIALADKRRGEERELALTAAGLVQERRQKQLDREYSLLEVQAKNLGEIGDNNYVYEIQYDMDPNSPTYGQKLADTNIGQRVDNPNDLLGYKKANVVFEIEQPDGTTIMVEKPRYNVLDTPPWEMKYNWAGLMDPEGDKWTTDQSRLGRIKSSIGKIDQVSAMFGDGNEIGFFYNPKAAVYTIGTIWNQLKGQYQEAGKSLPNLSQQEVEMAYNQIANDPNLNEEAKAIALQNLEQVVTGKGIYGDQNYFGNKDYLSYQETLAQYLNAELNDKLDVAGGMSINDLQVGKTEYIMGQMPFSGDDTMKDIRAIRNKGYSGTYFDINSGQNVPYDGGDTIGELADEKFEYLSDTAEKFGLVYDPSQRKFVPSFDSVTAPDADRSITLNLGGKEVVIPSTIAAVDIYATILGFDFARYIQPEQRLLKDTIQSSVGKFDLTGQFSSPQVLLSRVRGFKNQLIQEYNETIDQNFLPQYRARHYYKPDGYLPTTTYDYANPEIRYDGQIESSASGANAAADPDNLLKFYDIDVDLNLNAPAGAKLP